MTGERDQAKARAILVASVRVLNALGVKPGRSKLYKCFYIAHLMHAIDHGVILSDWPVVKMPRGPGPDEGKRLLEQLAAEEHLVQRMVTKSTRIGYEYEARVQDPGLQLRPEELATITKACETVKNEDADSMTDWSHRFSHAWNEAKKGDEIAIYADLLEDEDSADLRERLQDAKFHLKDVFRS